MNLRERLEALNPEPRVRVPSQSDAPMVNNTRFPLDYPLGQSALARYLKWLPPKMRSPLTSDEPIERVAFVDTETTGLSGGVGTHVFMVGLGHIDHIGFCVKQYVLHDLAGERAFLEEVGRALATFRVAITFNGKCFDFPQLKTRFDYHRLQCCLPPEHVDLLHLSRRLWRESLGTCDLATLEREILGITRHLDTPGRLIPSMYFRYLFQGDPKDLEAIALHNQRDVLSLLMLAGTISHTMEIGPLRHDPAHLFSLGRSLIQAGDLDRGLRYLEQALEEGIPPRLEVRARMLLARCYGRHGMHPEAKAHLEAACRSGGPAEIHVELAKALEHVDRDPLRALAIVEEGILRVSRDTTRRDLEKRRERLTRKILRYPLKK